MGTGGSAGVLPLEAAARLCREPVIAVDVGPGFDTAASAGRARAAPPLVRAHDDAVGTLDGGAHRRPARALAGRRRRPPLLYVRPRVERNATFQGGPDAPSTPRRATGPRATLLRALARALDPHPRSAQIEPHESL